MSTSFLNHVCPINGAQSMGVINSDGSDWRVNFKEGHGGTWINWEQIDCSNSFWCCCFDLQWFCCTSGDGGQREEHGCHGWNPHLGGKYQPSPWISLKSSWISSSLWLLGNPGELDGIGPKVDRAKGLPCCRRSWSQYYLKWLLLVSPSQISLIKNVLNIFDCT